MRVLPPTLPTPTGSLAPHGCRPNALPPFHPLLGPWFAFGLRLGIPAPPPLPLFLRCARVAPMGGSPAMSTSLGTPPHSGLYHMPVPLLPSPFPARMASRRPCGPRSLTAPLARLIRSPYRTSAAWSTYAVSTSRRSPPPPTLSLPVPPRGLFPLLSALPPASAGPRTSPTCHYLAHLHYAAYYPPFPWLKLHCVLFPSSPLLEFPRPPPP